MKRSITEKNLLDVVLAVFFVSWLFFLAVILGNGAGIFSYSDFSGKFVMTVGRFCPAVALYMFLIRWEEVKDPAGFFERLLGDKSLPAAFLTVAGFSALHLALCRFSCHESGRSVEFLPSFLWALLVSGHETVWSGFFFSAFRDKKTYLPACMLNGFAFFLYSVPFWCIDGLKEELGEPVYYFLFCCLSALIVGSIYVITESVAAAVLTRGVLQLSVWFYTDMILGNPRVYLTMIIEVALLTLAAYLTERSAQKKAPVA